MYVMVNGIVHGDLMKMSSMNVVQKRICWNMYKCRDSQVCIHVGDICDGQDDCHKGDDELMCSLKDYWCPVEM